MPNSDVNENHAAQVATELISALNDQAMEKITGGYDRVEAEFIAKTLFDSGKVVADVGVHEDYARQALALALQSIVFVPKPDAAA